MIQSIIGIALLLWLIFTLYLAVKVKKLAATREVKRIVVVWLKCWKCWKLPVAYCLNIKSAREYVREVLKGEVMIKENDFEFKWVDLRHPSKK